MNYQVLEMRNAAKKDIFVTEVGWAEQTHLGGVCAVHTGCNTVDAWTWVSDGANMSACGFHGFSDLMHGTSSGEPYLHWWGSSTWWGAIVATNTMDCACEPPKNSADACRDRMGAMRPYTWPSPPPPPSPIQPLAYPNALDDCFYLARDGLNDAIGSGIGDNTAWAYTLREAATLCLGKYNYICGSLCRTRGVWWIRQGSNVFNYGGAVAYYRNSSCVGAPPSAPPSPPTLTTTLAASRGLLAALPSPEHT